jgi:hypothetical protein
LLGDTLLLSGAQNRKREVQEGETSLQKFNDIQFNNPRWILKIFTSIMKKKHNPQHIQHRYERNRGREW